MAIYIILLMVIAYTIGLHAGVAIIHYISDRCVGGLLSWRRECLKKRMEEGK